MNAIGKTLVVVGMPGAGKSSVGKKLASRLGLRFVDSDHEVETAAGMTIEQIFTQLGEAEFRLGERRVITRLLEQPPCVLATGGGAFMDATTRALIQERAISVWLRVDLPILQERVARRHDRPLLKGPDPAAAVENLLKQREPVYAEAHIAVTSDLRPADETVDRVMQALETYLAKKPETA